MNLQYIWVSNNDLKIDIYDITNNVDHLIKALLIVKRKLQEKAKEKQMYGIV